MVGIFSRFSVRGGHRRAQSTLDEREILPTSLEATTGASSASASAVEFSFEFKPVERPTEPLDNDLPIQCPFPEPSILNDGSIWRERVSSSAQKRAETTPAMHDQDPLKPEPIVRKARPPSNRVILPSISAPEHNILKLLDECNTSGI